MKNKKQKRITVLFSGGLDSTYLVWKLLEEGHIVEPVYFEIANNKGKTISEKRAIKIIFDKFKENYKSQLVHYETLKTTKIEILGGSSWDRLISLAQVPVWIFGMMYINGKAADEVHVGYVLNDDAISFIPEIRKIYNSYKGICCEKAKAEWPKLKFPIIKMSKDEIWRELPTEYRDHVWWCENPTHDGNYENLAPCEDHCVACKKAKSHGIEDPNKKGLLFKAIQEKLKGPYRLIRVKEEMSVLSESDEEMSFEEFPPN